MPQISIIIPTYNYAGFIRETLDSALKQDFEDYEVIVVDDGSTDNTKDVLEPYITSKKIRYIFQENQGLSAARNTGIRESTSPYLTFLDADDLFTANKLEVLYQAFTEHPEAGLVYGNHVLWTGEFLYKQPRFADGDAPSGWILPELFQHTIMSVPSVLVRRKAFEAAGNFNESLTSAEDWDMWLRISAKFRVYYVDQVVTYVRVHPKSMSKNFINMSLNKLRVQKKAYVNFQGILLKTFLQKELDAMFGQTYFELAKHQLLQGKPELVKKYAKISVGLDRSNIWRAGWLLPATFVQPLAQYLFRLKMKMLDANAISTSNIPKS